MRPGRMLQKMKDLILNKKILLHYYLILLSPIPKKEDVS